MITAAIFDADGTLFDSMKIWRDAGARYLALQGIAAAPGLADVLFSMSLEEGAAYLKEQYQLSETQQEVRSGVLSVIADFYHCEVELKPGSADFLNKLQARGIPMVIATTGDEALVRAALRRLGIAGYFKRIFTCSELNTTKKEPHIYQTAAEYLSASPHEVLVFEDALYAITTASAAGFVTVAVEDAASAADKRAILSAANVYLSDFLDFTRFWRMILEN